MLSKSSNAYTIGNLFVSPLDQDNAAYAYLMLKREGMLENFYSMGVPDLATFMARHCFATGCLALGGFVSSGEGSELAGIGLMPQPQASPCGLVVKSEVSEVFLRKHQHRSVTLPLAKMMLEWVFDHSQVTVIYGTTPTPNRAAMMFMKALGFNHMLGEIPFYATWHGKECGVIVSWLTRKRWEELGWFNA